MRENGYYYIRTIEHKWIILDWFDGFWYCGSEPILPSAVIYQIGNQVMMPK